MTVKMGASSILAMAAFALLGALAPAPAAAAPAIDIGSSIQPSEFSSHLPHTGVAVGSRAAYVVSLKNVGDAPTEGEITAKFTAPPGLEVTQATGQKLPFSFISPWTCSVASDSQSATCGGAGDAIFGGLFVPVFPGAEPCFTFFQVVCNPRFAVSPAPGTEAGATDLTPTAEVCGGGTGGCVSEALKPIDVVPHFEVTSFDAGTFTGAFNSVTPENYDPIMDQSGDPHTQAGSQPGIAATKYTMTQAAGADGLVYSTGDQKDVIVSLPAGTVVNTEAIPTCSDAQLSNGSVEPDCPLGSQVGFIGLSVMGGLSAPDKGEVSPIYVPLFNMEAPDGKYALLGFNFVNAVFHITGHLSRDPSVPGGYRATTSLLNTAQTLSIDGSSVSIWGVPAAESHDPERGWTESSCVVPDPDPSGKCAKGFTSTSPEAAFVTLPTSCPDKVRSDITINTWQGDEDTATSFAHAVGDPETLIGIEGCNTLSFAPTLEARPTTNVADSPSGLDVNLHIPENQDPTETATAHLRDATITLPEGMSINPSGASGLTSCAPGQIELQGEKPNTCPDASKIGSVRADTQLFDHPVSGGVYVAAPYDNPFGSLFALYVTIEDPQTGTMIKFAGKVSPDPATGRLTTTFTENPQVPFEDLRLRIFGGATGVFRTPSFCGSYTATSSLTPWSAPDSGPPSTPQDSWSLEQGPEGGICATAPGDQPLAPSFDAGTVSPIAGATSPMVVTLRRLDGTQRFSSVTLTPPPGLLGTLAGIPYCPPAALTAAAAKSGIEEQANPSCPAASRVGSVVAAAGAGPSPYHALGSAYLAGPYKGAPLSLAIVTPATAGPFDLGTIVVRAALKIDPVTAQITAVSDSIPSILEGVPLDVQMVRISLDRPDFTFNPTSCDPMTFEGQLASTLGQSTLLHNGFQVAECSRLDFAPRLSLSLRGGTTRGKHPALTATLRTRPGDANLKSISVAFPPVALLDQGNIDNVCTRVQFAADNCPASSIYGRATVITPLLDSQLSGPVYLRSSGGKLPDLVPDLRGPASQPIKLEAAGKTDTVKGGLRNTFKAIPDAPFSKLVLKLSGGKNGLLRYSTDICARTFRATVKATAHNETTTELRPRLNAKGCEQKRRRSNDRSRSRAGR